MKKWRKVWCRTVQTAFRAALPILPYREPKLLASVTDIPQVLKEHQVDSVLLVTDKPLRTLGATAKLEGCLRDAGIHCAVYDETQPNPTIKNVEAARDMYLANKCTCLLAFGGGSSMDCAKAVGARIAYPNRPIHRMKGTLKVLRRIPLLIAVPTTAGTGSEVTLAAVITDGEKHHKYPMNNFVFIPRYAVLDPEMTYSLPPHLTATTGMDALTHAIEAYIGRSTTKETRSLALKATELIFDNIETAYRDGQNHAARANMLKASYYAGAAFSQSYVGYIHAIAHSLGGQYNVPHGLANAVIMPHVLKHYGTAAHKKLHELGVAAGVAKISDSDQVGANKLIDAICEMNRRMGIPEHIPGVIKEDIPMMAQHADREANPLYPVPVLMDAHELESLYARVADWSQT